MEKVNTNHEVEILPTGEVKIITRTITESTEVTTFSSLTHSVHEIGSNRFWSRIQEFTGYGVVVVGASKCLADVIHVIRNVNLDGTDFSMAILIGFFGYVLVKVGKDSRRDSYEYERIINEYTTNAIQDHKPSELPKPVATEELDTGKSTTPVIA